MPTSFLTLNLTADHAVPVQPGGGTATVTVTSGQSVYYSTDADITATHNEGTLVLSTPVAFTGQVWLRSAGFSTVTVQLDSASPSAGGGGGGGGGMTKLFDSTVSGADATSIDTGAGGVAAGYASLLIHLFTRTDESSPPGQLYLRLNNDSGGNYDWQRFYGSTATVVGSSQAADAGWPILTMSAGNTALYFGSAQITIPNYTDATNYKAATYQAGYADLPGTTSRAEMRAGAWRSASVISRVAVLPLTGGQKLKIGSRMTIWGLN